jgi:hypothetical protein
MNHDQPPTATKPCARCGVDCTTLARVKDDKGRYFCRPCYDRAIAQMASRIVGTAPGAGRPLAPGPIQAPIQAPNRSPNRSTAGHSGSDTNSDLDAPADLLGVADEQPHFPEGRDAPEPALDGIYELAVPEHTVIVPTKECPSCAREMRERDSVCPHCGFNTILNQEADDELPTVTAVFKNGKACCGECGYNIENLGTTKCPECGSPNRIPRRSEWDQEDSDAIARTQIVRPGIYLAVGLAGFGILAAMREGTWEFVAYLALYLIGLPAVIGSFLLCSLLWLGFNDKLSLVAWKLTGIMALTSLVLFLFDDTGRLFIPLVLAGVTFTTLIRIELDVDSSDSFLVGLAALIAQFAAYFISVTIAVRMGWL